MTAFPEDVVNEVVLSARYGDVEDLQQITQQYGTSILSSHSSNGNTPLHMASANGHTEAVQFILQQLPQQLVNAQNEGGNTPLHWAALNGHMEIVELLVKAGADPELKNQANRSAMFEAQQNNHEKIIDFLLMSLPDDGFEGAEEEDEEETEVAESS
ncbi:ankyrin repeat-containing protein [Basidiobolus ranarum]|uniref:Ankyrin repeat-containing protein n=1 Tax=Basidiobolus ranarum TaxID=34480 RepID=A0ABR2WTD4_9FUNG